MAAAEDPRPVVVVTGALAPYTHVLYNDLARGLDRPLRVLVCSAGETSRLWRLDQDRAYGFEVLPGLRWHRSTVVNHYANPSVARRLLALRPAALVLNDFSPTMLVAASVARLRGIPYGLRTDGVPETDPGRGWGPRGLIRRIVAGGAAFGIGPSQGSRALLESCGLAGPFSLSPLLPAWQPSSEPPAEGRPHDVLFCGSLNDEVKGARFFTDVVLGCAERGRRLSVRVAGEGPLRGEMESRFRSAGLEARFDGFLQQDRLAEAYASARLFHFPSRNDVWGIVVQEALQSGTVVVASPHAGAARELVAAEGAGLVLPLDRDAWIRATIDLLADEARCSALRAAGRRALRAYTPARARDAYLDRLGPVLRPGAGHIAAHPC